MVIVTDVNDVSSQVGVTTQLSFWSYIFKLFFFYIQTMRIPTLGENLITVFILSYMYWIYGYTYMYRCVGLCICLYLCMCVCVCVRVVLCVCMPMDIILL